jgi:hypothetical protein
MSDLGYAQTHRARYGHTGTCRNFNGPPRLEPQSVRLRVQTDPGTAHPPTLAMRSLNVSWRSLSSNHLDARSSCVDVSKRFHCFLHSVSLAMAPVVDVMATSPTKQHDVGKKGIIRSISQPNLSELCHAMAVLRPVGTLKE